MAQVFNIPSGVPFVDALATGILARVEADGGPLALAGYTVLLPTRRACRTLREAFLRLSGGAPQLLPRMSPLGDIDADELSLAIEEIPGLAGALDLPPALTSLRRQLLLAQAILRKDGKSITADQAARLAADLARLLDQVQTEGVPFDRLEGLVPEEYAQHWQVTLEFLKILTHVWPTILELEGAIDAAERRNLVLKAQAEAWRANPPAGPVIAAGSTGTIPATAELLAVVATMPNGCVVLPGLDTDMDGTSWDAAASDDGHPQHGMASLLRKLDLPRDGVQPWDCPLTAGNPARTRLLSETMRPAATTEAWRGLDGIDETALRDITRIDCPTSQEEAAVIALMMRQTLEVPDRTAALVTPDRNLARRVATALERWNIAVDDSGGRPLADTAVGTYLRLTAACAVERADPLPLLAVLKHPLAGGGLNPLWFRTQARDLERAVLRGPRPAPGFRGLLAALDDAENNRFDRGDDTRRELVQYVEHLHAMAAPFFDAMEAPDPQPPAEWLTLHVAFAERLAAGDDLSGPDRLWRHEDGEAAAGFVNELRQAAGDFPPIPASQYPAFLEALMAAHVVRPRYGRHPRLSILGLLEARLQHADVMILGGLNEGTWPPDAASDPWLSRPMRKAFGLPVPERLVGVAAHDFVQAAGGARVVLSRAERVDGTPTVPSRWLLRLDTVLRGLDLNGIVEMETEQWLSWVDQLDRPDAVRPLPAPEPRPPLSARPRSLSVTEIETWMRDPYAIYARRILKLEALEPIAADPGASERGQFIHQALDAFTKAYPDALPNAAVEKLTEFGRDAFGKLLSQPEVWAFWWPRFERVAAWFIQFETERRRTVRPLATEIKGKLELEGPAGPFTLRAKADRIDKLPDGGLAIIDYKTGTPPSNLEVALGFAPQLPLEAVMAAAGGFETVDAAPVGDLAFWKLSGGDPAGAEIPVKGDLALLAEQARTGLIDLIRTFDDPATPYRSRPRPDWAPRYTDYGHLARVQEWSAAGGEPVE
ncbi:double-strand break repair protein AddB [Skermanella sp. TT6]|uniref:Double-strand break repair protein AddB n=1 Tax=Skermanella cutis TaxID=2775420 RepID=A0ABX7B497_9PROT|nr:double-strand break repair protein AddB [Skermanella sp. TT6]QQP87960.1 double-strand break repair protein AddB [Skermanella sp. TT6]